MPNNPVTTEEAKLGKTGIKRLDAAGTATYTGKIIAIKALNGNAVYGSGCVAPRGDAPVEDDIILDGDIHYWSLSTVVIKTGEALVYIEDRLVLNE